MTSKTDRAIAEVIATERAWVEAHCRLDVAALDAIMAGDYAVIAHDGRVVGKAEDLASYASGKRHWDFADSDEYDIRIYGDTAVLIGRWQARGVNDGVHFDYAARFVSVYVKQAGSWRMVFAQSTPQADSSS